jgi:acetyltransferase-like isoleucine patch superfamily enzyme
LKILSVFYNKFIYRPMVRRKLQSVGVNFRLGYHSELLNPHLFNIGDNFFSGPYCYFVTNQYSPVRICDNVMFGPHCKIIGGNHDYTWTKGYLNQNDKPLAEFKEILIENGAWIGANSVILTGAKIGEGSVIGSMGLVKSVVPPYSIAIGVPANRLIARFECEDHLAELLSNVDSKYSVDDVRKLHDTCHVMSRSTKTKIYCK